MNYSPLSSETQENEDLPYRKLQTLKKKNRRPNTWPPFFLFRPRKLTSRDPKKQGTDLYQLWKLGRPIKKTLQLGG